MGKINDLVLISAEWQDERAPNHYLLRQVFDLLLQKPLNLTNPQETDEMLRKMMKEKEGSKR